MNQAKLDQVSAKMDSQFIHIEQTLWKKESIDESSVYEDPFATIEIDEAEHAKEWKQQLIAFVSPECAFRSIKSNKIADQHMDLGHTEFRKRNWNDAVNLYSRALCFAVPGTLYEGMAHGNRALCFYHLAKYDMAIIDFDFAMRKKCPEQFLAYVYRVRAKCQKLIKKRSDTKQIPKLGIPADKKFPCMANLLEIIRNKNFGRCVVAKRDIEIGTTVFVAEHFASAITSNNQVYCLTCQNTESNLIPCEHCSDVMFCNEDCANWDNLHKMECCTCYHQIDDITIKFIIQTVLVAIEIFATVENLMKFVEEVTADEGFDKIPKSSCDSTSKYGIFLKLTPSYKYAYWIRAYQAFTCINLMPKVKYLFDTLAKQRFLMHLVLHHSIVIPKNAFSDVVQCSHQFTLKYIFDVLSILNHSCAPNLEFDTVGKFGYCVSVRPIQRGDQVFINYMGDDVYKTTELRQKSLKDCWGFECKCDKCEVIPQTDEHEAMKEDASLKYIISNYENDRITKDHIKRFQLKKHCIKFLQKYGHLSWSTELEYVISCFTSL